LEKRSPGADKWSDPTVKERSNQDDPIRIRIRTERLQCDAWSSDRLQSAASSVQSVGQKSRPQNEDEITIPGRREASRWQTPTFNQVAKEREKDESEKQTQKQTSQKQRCFIFQKQHLWQLL
jgi:hypothetical protein